MTEVGKTGRWRNAAGELTLIVVGVLVALWIEGCRQERVDRANERAYLERLESDLVQDVERIEGLVAHSRQTDESARLVLAFLDSDRIEGDADLVSTLNRAGFINFFRQNRSTYDDLLSTGNLRLLQNKALVRELGDYYRSTDFLEHFDDQKKRAVWFDYRPRLAPYLPPTGFADLGESARQVANEVDWLGLRQDPDLPGSIGGVLGTTAVERRMLGQVRASADAVLQLIVDELGSPIHDD